MRENSSPRAVHAPLSVIIPCYCAKDLERTIASVHEQTWRPAEVILIDDASPDNTYDLLFELADRFPEGWIKVQRRKVNGGPGLARNDGLDLASQPYAAFLDADDTWHPQKTALQLGWMLDNPEVSASSTRRVQFESRFENIEAPPAVQLLSFQQMLWRNYTSTSGTILKSDLDIRFSKHRRYCEDYEFWLEILRTGCKGALIKAPLAFCHKASYGESGLSAQLWKMEKNELGVYRDLQTTGAISSIMLPGYWTYSLSKFAIRVVKTTASTLRR